MSKRREQVANTGNGFSYEEPLLFERSRPGRQGYSLPEFDVPAVDAAALLPEARMAVMASDLIHGPAQAAELVRAVADHEVDLVIGTQLVAKGHHFPMLTLVGVVDADLGLAGGDLLQQLEGPFRGAPDSAEALSGRSTSESPSTGIYRVP